MHVDRFRERGAVFRKNASCMVPDRLGQIETAPSHPLSSPSEIDILPVGKKALIKIFLFLADILQTHRPAIERCRARCAEDIFGIFILARIGLP